MQTQTIERTAPTQARTAVNTTVKLTDSVLYHQGDAARTVFRVRSGIVMAYRIHDNGTRQITGFFQRGDMVGFAGEGDGEGEYTDTAVMVSDGRLETLSAARVARDPALQGELYRCACRQLQTSQTLIVLLTRKSSEAKVAEFLLHLSRPRRDGTPRPDITLPSCRQDIADYLGISNETVSRKLAAFRREGIVDLPTRRSARILDYAALQARAAA